MPSAAVVPPLSPGRFADGGGRTTAPATGRPWSSTTIPSSHQTPARLGPGSVSLTHHRHRHRQCVGGGTQGYRLQQGRIGPRPRPFRSRRAAAASAIRVATAVRVTCTLPGSRSPATRSTKVQPRPEQAKTRMGHAEGTILFRQGEESASIAASVAAPRTWLSQTSRAAGRVGC